MSENDLYEVLARYLNVKHPGLIYHFDLSGVWTPSHKARNLYGRLNKRAWPDLFIAKRSSGCPGLFIELKADGARLRKVSGDWATEHIAEQAAVLESLAKQGYIAQFATGFDEAVSIIESYLAGWEQLVESDSDDLWDSPQSDRTVAAA